MENAFHSIVTLMECAPAKNVCPITDIAISQVSVRSTTANEGDNWGNRLVYIILLLDKTKHTSIAVSLVARTNSR